MSLAEKIFEAGVVGCGGAGFPSHIKAQSKADTVIANGAECEPLLHKDSELLLHDPESVVDGMRLMMESVGATRGLIGVKKKYAEQLSRLATLAAKNRIDLHWLGDYYPTGDEYVLVYESTKRSIPTQGYPVDVGVVVNNVETLRNISLADRGIAVTSKYVTVAGAVRHPSTFLVPIGTPFSHLISLAGGTTITEFSLFVSGVMMGKLESDLERPVTKTCAGVVVLSNDHPLVRRKNLPVETMHKIGKSACDQCSYCTEFCPRYLLGYDVQPHKVMRSLGFTSTGEQIWNQWAQLCCSCGLCTLYACPEDLYPKEACDKAKIDLRSAGLKWNGRREIEIHPIYEGRHVPLKQLINKLGLSEYDVPAPFSDVVSELAQIRLPLSQHIGTAALPIVKVGQKVKKGDVVASVPQGKLGASIHASISGTVKQIGDEIVVEHS
jgi:Na+-translocating ferredoxin:NAD+ oxidoreductase RnfC subunit